MAKKFDSIDRERVIFFIQAEMGQRLKTVSPWQRVLRADDGTIYVIFGGYEVWHGISEDTLSFLESDSNEIFMVVAAMSARLMKIYLGSMSPFVEKGRILDCLGEGKRQFHVTEKDECLTVDEIPSVCLELQGDFPHQNGDRAHVERMKRLRRQFDTLSVEEKAEVMKKLRGEE